MPFVSVLALAWLYQAPGLEGQEYLGARAVLSKILKPPNGSVLKDVKFVFAGDLRSFERYSPSMSPSAAASSWLDLAQRSFAIADTDSTPGQSGLAPVLSALPSPNSWPLIQAGLKDRDFGDPARGPAIHLLMDVLQGKTKDAWADLEAFAKLRTDSTRVSELDWLRLALAMHWHDSDRIDSAVTHEADMTASENGVLFGGGPSMQIPDLVVLLGKARARKLLTHVLLTAKAELSFDFDRTRIGDNETEKLARQIAIENGDRLAYPQWTLAVSPDAGDLFGTFRKRFPKITMGITWSNPPSGSTYHEAALNRFFSLFLSGDRERTELFAASYANSFWAMWDRQIEQGYFKRIERAGRSAPFLSFAGEMAARYPASQLPSIYLDAVGQFSPLSRQEKIFRKFGSTKGLPDYERHNCENDLLGVYLREGKQKEAADTLVRRKVPSEYDPFETNGNQLVALGEAMNRPDLVNRGLDRTLQGVATDPFASDNSIDLLIRHGRGPEVEKRLIKQLSDAVHSRSISSPPEPQQAALSLAEFYEAAARYSDVVALLDRFPKWDAPDISYLVGYSRSELSALLMAATALAKVGRHREALSILRTEIQRNPSHDADYAALLECGGSVAGPILDGLAREFPVESRPLIWKAKLLLAEGQRSLALEVARKAVEMDPDDMEGWGSPTRFSAQQVLAEARGAQASPSCSQSAALVQRAVYFEESNIYGPAIELYRKALAVMPQDFRARMQLGIDLIRTGREAEGEQQVRTACRNLPPKWGNGNDLPNMEYDVGSALTVAETALQEQVKRGTRNPGVYAFLGRLGYQDGPASEKIAMDERAVQLDSDCLTAWRGLSGLILELPAGFQLTVTENELRLSPPLSGYYYYYDLDIPDYRRCWLEAAKACARRIPSSTMLFELRASRAALQGGEDQGFLQNELRMDDQFPPPGAEIAGDRVIEAIDRLCTKPFSPG